MTGWEALRTLSLIRGTTHVVQSGTPRNHGMMAGPILWETIAAFNVERAANNYMRECRKATGLQYRVQVLEGWDP